MAASLGADALRCGPKKIRRLNRRTLRAFCFIRHRTRAPERCHRPPHTVHPRSLPYLLMPRRKKSSLDLFGWIYFRKRPPFCSRNKTPPRTLSRGRRENHGADLSPGGALAGCVAHDASRLRAGGVYPG